MQDFIALTSQTLQKK